MPARRPSTDYPGKAQPLNISISFNINPKSIVHQQARKIIHQQAHSIFTDAGKNSANNNRKKHRSGFHDRTSPRVVPCPASSKQKYHQDGLLETISDKKLDSMKKDLFEKINNFAIEIPVSPLDALEGKANTPASDADDRIIQTQQFNISKYQSEKQDEDGEMSAMFTKRLAKANLKIGNYVVKEIKEKDKAKKKKAKELVSKSENRDLGKHRSVGSSQLKAALSARLSKNKHSSSQISAQEPGQLSKRSADQNLKKKLQVFKVDIGRLIRFYEDSELITSRVSDDAHVQQIEIGDLYSLEKSQELQVGVSILDEPESNIVEIYKHLKISDMNATLEEKDKEDEVIGFQGLSVSKQIQGIQQEDFENQFDSTPSARTEKVETEGQISKQIIPGRTVPEILNYIHDKLVDSTADKAQTLEMVYNALSAIATHQPAVQYEMDTGLQENVRQQTWRQDDQQVSSIDVPVIDAMLNEAYDAYDTYDKFIKQEPSVNTFVENSNQKEKSRSPKLELLDIKRSLWRQYQRYQKIVETIPKKSRVRMKSLSAKDLQHVLHLSKLQKKQAMTVKEVKKTDQAFEKNLANLELQLKSKLKEQAELGKVSPDDINDIKDENNDIPPNPPLVKEICEFSGSATLLSQLKISDNSKNQIFQFVFLDLCIQLYQEAIQEQCKKKKTPKQAPKLPEYATMGPAMRIISKITEWVDKLKLAQRQTRKGIDTSREMITDYLLSLRQYLLTRCKHENWFLGQLNYPLGPTDMEILKELRYCCETSFGDSFGLQVNLADSLMANEAERYVLKAEVFSSFESTVVKSKPLTFSRIYADDAIENRRIEMLKNCVYMHHKAIFDCFNECLDYQRPFGIWGKPFIWRSNPVFYHYKKEAEIQNSVNKAIERVILNSEFECGMMPDKDYLLEQLRDERMYRLLQLYIFELQEKWMFLDDDETEIMMELSNSIWQQLVKELVKEIIGLTRSKLLGI